MNPEAMRLVKERIELTDGAGGEAMAAFLSSHILSRLDTGDINVHGPGDLTLGELDDSSTVGDTAFTTDMYTVRPVFFPGGDLGRLAVCGTVNDLSVVGARPMALSLAFLIEAGFKISDIEMIMESVRTTCAEAGVPIITGDTKVVESGSIDGIYACTSGIGVVSEELRHNAKVLSEMGRDYDGPWLRDRNLRDGDIIIASGYIGDHGVAVLSSREGYGFETEVKSDVQPLNTMMSEALRVGGIVAAKDPTRGGVANLLNEWRSKSNMGIVIEEDKIPLRPEVRSACDLLGIDPLTIGNEGKALIAVANEQAEDVLKALRRTDAGKYAAIVGRVDKAEKYVVMETEVGGRRIVEAPVGDPVPRIC